jgi:hypothetical protein
VTRRLKVLEAGLTPKRLVVSAWLGLALAALFFYPLAVALSTDIYYLQWRTGDVVETAAALVSLACLFGAIVFAVWPRPTRTAYAVLAAVSVVPLASFAAGLSRQLPFQETLITAGDTGAIGAVMSAAGGAALVALLVWPAGFGRWLRRLLVLVSPVSLVVLASLIASAARADVVVRIDRGAAAAGSGEAACAPVLALLFDELSFYYVYDQDDNIRPELQGLSRLGSQATHYLTVVAPGRETLDALPSFLAARRVREIEVRDSRLMERGPESELLPFDAALADGLFGTARRLGFSTEIGGYYLAYCDMLREVVDVCRSRSFYNVSPVDSFSLTAPIRTTLVLWPRQFPFGLLKLAPFARHQRNMVEDLTAFARRPIERHPPTFRLMHFSVPHLPFVFDADGYDPPPDPLLTAPDDEYVQQVQYVDRMVAGLMEELRRAGVYDETTIVVLADHGYRFGGRERDPLQIPFIVKQAGQQQRAEVRAERQGETLLKDILTSACRR